MDEKLDIAKMEGGVKGSRLIGVSMMLLSLLLAASVASLIYISVTNSTAGCQAVNHKTSEFDVKASVTVKTEEKEVQERIEYSEGGHMSYMYGSNGEFDFDDFRKGIHLTRNNENGVCYLIPTGNNQTVDRQVEAFVKEWDGKEVDAKHDDVTVQIYDGKLIDVSFLPQRVQDECTNGYQWMAITSNKNEVSKEADEVLRQKREYCIWITTYYYCYYPYPYITICYRRYLYC